MTVAAMRRRWGLVLSGGGARGAFQVGVLERLLQDPDFEAGPVAISGTSAGGINAALLAAGKSPTEMRQFWRDIAADPPVVVNAQLFEDALRTVADLIGEDSLDVFGGGPALRRFVQRAQNHVPPRLGSMLALVTEYVLTSRFDLVGRFLGGLRHSALADTSRLRQRLVEAFGGESIPERTSRCAINTVDVRTGRVVRYVTAATPLTREPDYHVVPAITVDMVLASASMLPSRGGTWFCARCTKRRSAGPPPKTSSESSAMRSRIVRSPSSNSAAFTTTGGSAAMSRQNCRISAGVLPAASSAALIPPADVPEMATGPLSNSGSWRSRSSTPTWTAPRAPPPDSTSPHRRRIVRSYETGATQAKGRQAHRDRVASAA
jgi:hypothetical protein